MGPTLYHDLKAALLSYIIHLSFDSESVLSNQIGPFHMNKNGFMQSILIKEQ